MIAHLEKIHQDDRSGRQEDGLLVFSIAKKSPQINQLAGRMGGKKWRRHFSHTQTSFLKKPCRQFKRGE
jgi:hypothetical protein